MTKRLIFLAMCVISAAGCSSLLEDHQQTVSIRTYEGINPVVGVACQLANDKGTWAVTTPGVVEVISSAQDLVVTCHKVDGNVGSTGILSAVARPTPGYLTNPSAAVVVPVGAPSSFEQLTKGVAQRYPSNIHVVMGQEIMVTSGK